MDSFLGHRQTKWISSKPHISKIFMTQTLPVEILTRDNCSARMRLFCSGMDGVNRESKVSTPKDKKNAPAGDEHHSRPRRRKEKLIRLDDLLPKSDVMGGRQLLFGATDTTQQQTNNPKQQDN
jgi:hypothetical protein